jgi:putative transposase
MPNTFTQIHLQCVFAVKFREALISKTWQDRLHDYIAAIISNKGHKILAINSMPDHLHVFFGMRPTQGLSDLIQAVKGDSSEWINKQKLARGYFRWQEVYGGFSYKKTDVDTIVKYVHNQQQHHIKKTFLQEYQELLREFEVAFDEQYIFKEPT